MSSPLRPERLGASRGEDGPHGAVPDRMAHLACGAAGRLGGSSAKFFQRKPPAESWFPMNPDALLRKQAKAPQGSTGVTLVGRDNLRVARAEAMVDGVE